MSNKRRGFTLIEILVVTTIIGLFATMGFVSYVSFNQQARDARRKADLEQIRAVVEMYRSNNSTYPSTLTAVIPDYMKSLPTDPKTKTVYVYTPTCEGTRCNDYIVKTTLERGGCYQVGPYGESSCNGWSSDPTPKPVPTCVPIGGVCDPSLGDDQCCQIPEGAFCHSGARTCLRSE